jgi:Arc-like DNA binding domain
METRAMVARKKTDTIQLSKIRMSEDLRRKLAREAEKNGATLNGEIVDRLEASFTHEEINALLERKMDLTIQIAVEKAMQGVREDLDRREKERGPGTNFYDALSGKTKGDEK